MHPSTSARVRLVLLLAAGWLASSGVAAAQPLGAAPGRREIEIGGSSFMIRRTVRYPNGTLQGSDWGRGAAFARYGLTDWLALAGDGVIWHSGAADRFPNRDYWDVSVGVGATAALARRGPTRVSAAARFHMYSMIDQSAERFDKRTSHLTMAVLLERRLGAARRGADVWIGPAYVRDRLTQVPRYGAPLTARSQDDWGAVAGASIQATRWLRAFSQWSYAGRWQPEFGASVVF